MTGGAAGGSARRSRMACRWATLARRTGPGGGGLGGSDAGWRGCLRGRHVPVRVRCVCEARDRRHRRPGYPPGRMRSRRGRYPYHPACGCDHRCVTGAGFTPYGSCDGRENFDKYPIAGADGAGRGEVSRAGWDQTGSDSSRTRLVRTVPESKIVEALLEEALNLTSMVPPGSGPGGSGVGSVGRLE